MVDEDYLYGYGKVENIVGIIEILFIFVVGIWIIVELVNKFVNFYEICFLVFGIMVMFFGVIVNIIVFCIIKKVVDEVNLVVMKFNVLYLYIDVFILFGIVFSLFFVYIIGWFWLDFVIVILMVFYIMYEVYKLLKEFFFLLMDKCLFVDEEEVIK